MSYNSKMTLTWIILATFLISALSLTGALIVSVASKKLHHLTMILVSLAAGSLMGAAFFHLLPESIEALGTVTPFYLLMASFAGFFVLEKVLHWQHCHDNDCEVHSFGYLNLVGDGLHNFIDGLVIAATFTVSVELGIAATMAIALHEIPQEWGDFGILLHAGFKPRQALLANFGSALLAMFGGVLGYFLSQHVEGVIPFLLPLAAGSFLYIASADLMPELLEERRPGKSVLAFVFFVVGIMIMVVSAMFE